MTKYRLHYFNIRSRGEPIRWMFAVAKQPYEEVRITSEQWPTLKSTYLFGQLPMLEIDDKRLYQSYAIMEFLAKQFGMAGKTAEDEARASMIAHCIEDCLHYPWANLKHLAPDETKETAFIEKYETEELPAFLSALEKLLCENGGGDGYFVGDELTYADLVVVAFFEDVYNLFGAKISLDNQPKLASLKRRVESIPEIASHLTSRPSIDKPLINFFNIYVKKFMNV